MRLYNFESLQDKVKENVKIFLRLIKHYVERQTYSGKGNAFICILTTAVGEVE